MRSAKLLTALAGCLVVAGWAAAPAGAVVLPAGMSEGAPAAFSLTHAAPTIHQPPPERAATPRTGWRPRWFGYPTAQADEMPAPAPRPTMLFSHASLGIAALDSPVGAESGAIAVAGAGQLAPAEMRLVVPAPANPVLPSPLPIALIVALVLLPAGLVLTQALRGPPRRPVPAMRRPVARRRDDEG